MVQVTREGAGLSTIRRVMFESSLVLSVVVVLLAAVPAAAGSASKRQQIDQRGDFTIIGNSLASDCSEGTPLPVKGAVDQCGRNVTDLSPDVFWHADDSGSARADTNISPRQARSAAVLTLPSGATVSYARLYWAASKRGSTADLGVIVDRPGLEGFATTLVADGAASVSPATGTLYYQSSTDVTTLVQQYGPGVYRVADVDAAPLTDVDDNFLFAGWSLVVVYHLPTEPMRSISLFDGLDLVRSDRPPVDVLITGFSAAGPRADGRLGVVGYLGTAQRSGDSLSLDGTRLSDVVNPADNFFNGTRSFLGAPRSAEGDAPRLLGVPRSMSGMDIDIVDLTGAIPPRAARALFSATADQDAYLLGVLAMSVAVFKPDLSGTTKTVASLSPHAGGSILPGDTLEYTITGANTGTAGALSVTLDDHLPLGLSIVPGSLRLLTGPGAGPRSDATGDDEADYVADTRTLRVRLGAGANGTSGGKIAVGDGFGVAYRVTVDPTAVGFLENQAVIRAGDGESGATGRFVTDGNGGLPGAPATVIVVDRCADDSHCAGATPYCLLEESPQRCVACIVDTQCSGARGKCDPKDHVCRGCLKDADCPESLPACLPSGVCGECSSSTSERCRGSTPICDSGASRCVGCFSNIHCGGSTPVCNLERRACRACVRDDECPDDAPLCLRTGACGMCSTDDSSLCKGATPLCDTLRGLCVGCLTTDDCRGTAPVCDPEARRCRPCSQDRDCGEKAEVCLPTGVCTTCQATPEACVRPDAGQDGPSVDSAAGASFAADAAGVDRVTVEALAPSLDAAASRSTDGADGNADTDVQISGSSCDCHIGDKRRRAPLGGTFLWLAALVWVRSVLLQRGRKSGPGRATRDAPDGGVP